MGRVVVADDAQPNLDLLRAILQRDGYTVHTALDGAQALELTLQELPDVVVTDVVKPKLTGFELCRRIKDDRATRLIPVVLVTGLDGSQERIQGINAGADDFLTKPVNAQELRARVRSLVRLKRFTDELDSAESVILSLALTVEARDPYTAGHCARMASYASTLGAELQASDEEVSALSRAGYLHDVGKIGVPDAILLKPGRLTPQEFDVMKQHPMIGDRLCGDLKLLRLVRPVVRSHHERIDGSGYPDGLVGERIPLLAQIAAIVVDLHLPDMDGAEVLRLLQEDRELRSVPVVVLSADATPDQVGRLKASGARAYLTKPLDIATLLQMLDDLLIETRKHPLTRSA